MPKSSFSWKAGLAALLTGICFAVANIYLGYGALANLCFALAVICDLVVVVFAILWVYGKGWEAQPMQQMQGKPPMPGMPQMKGMPPMMQGMQIRPMPQSQPPQSPGATPGAAPDGKPQTPSR